MGTFEQVKTKKAHDPIEQGQILPVEYNSTENPLDSEANRAKLRKLQDWWYQARQALSASRFQMAIDEDFYDGEQWREEDKDVLEARGQLAQVFNLIKPTIDWLIGTEKRTRIDFKVHPRGESDRHPAEVKTQLLKFVSDVNRTGYHRSRGFADAVKVGVGWLEDGIRGDETDELLYSRYESWRHMWYDHLAVERDLSDARYIFRSKWTDLDLAQAMFPERAAALQACARSQNFYFEQNDEYFWNTDYAYRANENATTPYPIILDDAFNVDNRRDRVRLIECWYRQPEQVQIMKGNPAMKGLMFDKENPFMNQALQRGTASLYDTHKMVVWCAVFCNDYLLQDVKSPYRHNRFPFVPIWCYRKGRDNSPYGVIRNLRDPQEDLNKRRSKALYILSSNRMIADSDAFEDWDNAIEEKDRPDGALKKRPGADVRIENDTVLGSEHITIMQLDADFIQNSSGVTEENLGRETNAISGKAILAKQDQGSLTSMEPFDNLRFATQIQGENQNSLIEQYYTVEKSVRITENPEAVEFMEINKPTPEGVENDITASQGDFIVESQDFRESIRIAMFETIMATIEKLPPEVSIQLLDLAIEQSDLPKKDIIADRIRQVSGQIKPGTEDDPEVTEAQEKERIKAERGEAMEDAEMMARVAELQAKAKKLISETEENNLEKLGKAIEIAIATVLNKPLVKAADSLVKSAEAG